MIVGTAGHVDHGKTSLVRALTGVDTDRLAEEKARGISIALGFAHARLDGGPSAADEAPIGFVDVPGHQKFVQTMIAGAAGIDVGLLVVAADDGPMPQTREHVDILRWLGVERLVVALTKIDAVDETRVAGARNDIDALLADTPYRAAPVLPVSSVTGDGITALKNVLRSARRAAGASADARNFRLAIDRAFLLRGIGLVVTGTCFAGAVAVDDTITLLPGRLTARVRGLHVHDEAAASAHAGQRVALNLVGRGVEKSTVHRGGWAVGAPDSIETERVDVLLDGDGGGRFDARGWRVVRFHAGAAAVEARVALLDDVRVGTSGHLAQIVLERPLHCLAGDRFVLRDTGGSDGATGSIAGGVVLDADVPARGRRSDARLAFLRIAAAADERATLLHALGARAKGVDLARWNACRNTTFSASDVDARAVDASGITTLFSESRWSALLDRLSATLADEHARAPDTVGPGRDRLRRMAAPSMDPATFGVLVDAAKATGRVAQTGAWLHLPEHRASLSPEDGARFDRARPYLEAATEPNNPPRIRDLARALGDDEAALRATFVRLASRGVVYRVAHDHYFLPATVQALGRIATALAADEGIARAAAFRDRVGVGRKVAIQILEFFDRTGFTRRVGDDHRVIQPGLFDG